MDKEKQVAVLENIISELEMDLDGVRTLLSDLKDTRETPDSTYTWRLVYTINASLSRHQVALNEYGKSVEENKGSSLR